MWVCALSLASPGIPSKMQIACLMNQQARMKRWEPRLTALFHLLYSCIHHSLPIFSFLSFFLSSFISLVFVKKIPPSFAEYDTHHCAALSAPPIFLFLYCCCVFIFGVWHIARPRDERRVGPRHHTFICLPFPFYMQNAVKDWWKWK